jgi:MFS family permease
MISVIISSWALFFGIGLIMLGNGLQSSLLGLRATTEGFPTTVTGFVMTGYYAGFLVGSMIVPKLVGRVGHIRVFAEREPSAPSGLGHNSPYARVLNYVWT